GEVLVRAADVRDQVGLVVGLGDAAVGPLEAPDGDGVLGEAGLAVAPHEVPRQAGPAGGGGLGGRLDRVDLGDAGVAPLDGALQQVALHRAHEVRHPGGDLGPGHGRLVAGVAAHDGHLPGGQVAGADL